MNLFLQAAYKVQPDDVLSCYDIFKDFIWPLVISLLGVLTAYIIFKTQMSLANKEREDNDENIINVVRDTGNSLIMDIKEFIIALEKYDTYNSLDYSDTLDKTTFWSVNLNILLSFRYEHLISIFKLLPAKYPGVNEKFITFYMCIQSIKSNNKDINTQIDYFISNYDQLIKLINENLIATSKYMDSYKERFNMKYENFDEVTKNSTPNFYKEKNMNQVIESLKKNYLESRRSKNQLMALSEYFDNINNMLIIGENKLLMDEEFAIRVDMVRSAFMNLKSLFSSNRLTLERFLEELKKT